MSKNGCGPRCSLYFWENVFLFLLPSRYSYKAYPERAFKYSVNTRIRQDSGS